MKNSIVLSLMVLLVASTYGQRNVEQHFKSAKNQEIKLDFKFADTINVFQWDRQEIKVNATVQIDNGEGNNAYTLKSEESTNEVFISSDFGDYFERKDKSETHCNNSKIKIAYTVYVPKGCTLKVKSITGNVFIETFSGTLETDLIAGNVALKHYNGELSLKTVSGDLDVTMKNAEIDAKTLMGTIYSDLDIEIPENEKSLSGNNRILGSVDTNGKKVKLETVTGDIFMRKG
ncbi:MAG TPA: hypothetical protein ENH91_11370 [Leeuwenhoekiella sp.]|nr:hypothetical protein [Leeuwenhoekiella sp.]